MDEKVSAEIARWGERHEALRERVNRHDDRLDSHEKRLGGHDVQFGKIFAYIGLASGGAGIIVTVILHYIDKAWK